MGAALRRILFHLAWSAPAALVICAATAAWGWRRAPLDSGIWGRLPTIAADGVALDSMTWLFITVEPTPAADRWVFIRDDAAVASETTIADTIRLSPSLRGLLRTRDDRADCIVTIGWPLRFVTLTTEVRAHDWVSFGGANYVASRFDRDRALPRVAVVPLLVDMVAWAVVLVALVLALAGMRGVVRRVRGRCAHCGHDERHARSPECNECGRRWSTLALGRLLLPAPAVLALFVLGRLEHRVLSISSTVAPQGALLADLHVEEVRGWTFVQDDPDEPPPWCIAGRVPRWQGDERAMLICVGCADPERMQLQLVLERRIGSRISKLHQFHTIACDLAPDTSPTTVYQIAEALVRRFDEAEGRPGFQLVTRNELLGERSEDRDEVPDEDSHE